MWIPGGVVYIVAALMLLAFWIRDSEPTGTEAPSPRRDPDDAREPRPSRSP
jgi:hypothetical protein